MSATQLNEVESLEYLSKRFDETGQASDMYKMVVGDTNYTFPASYTISDKLASVMLSSEQCLEDKTLTWGPGGVIILEEPTDPEVYAMLLKRYADIPVNESYAGDFYRPDELDDTVTKLLKKVSHVSKM